MENLTKPNIEIKVDHMCNGLEKLTKLDIQIRVIRRRSEGEGHFLNYNFPCSDEVRLLNAMVQNDCLCMYKITPKGNLLGGDLYIKQVQEHRDLQRKKEQREIQESEKFELELRQVKRQVKVFWPVLIVSLILHLCTITGLTIKFLEKPIIQKQYIPVDSHGKIYEVPK